jgi:hypothetical protein
VEQYGADATESVRALSLVACSDSNDLERQLHHLVDELLADDGGAGTG